MIRTLAIKISRTSGFSRYPQQSDYVARWHNAEGKENTEVREDIFPKKLIKRLYRRCPLRMQYAIDEYRARHNLSNRNFFVPWKGELARSTSRGALVDSGSDGHAS